MPADAPILVIDYHKGNLQSVERGLVAAGGRAFVSDDPNRMAMASGLVLPGVGSFEDAMDFMRASGQDEAVVEAIRSGVPFLGICLGLHLLFERGDERTRSSEPEGMWAQGLSVLTGSVRRLASSRLKVPHVGWDQIDLTEHGRDCPLFEGVPEGCNMYFTHSYALADDIDGGVAAARTHYARSFASAIWQDNVYGVQFHPEKSSGAGLAILENFVRIVGRAGAGA